MKPGPVGMGGRISIPVPSNSTTVKKSFEPNKRDDVMLVQYLLKRVYQKGHYCNPQLNPASGAAALKVDGLYGPKTAGAIEQFQLEMRRSGKNVATDGCFDSELGDDQVSSISKTVYAISLLNEYFWSLYPMLAPDIRFDPECPPELKQAVGNGAF
jgi:peptidoglycan hydrolase-like protein with peptidoglycan-binding domain